MRDKFMTTWGEMAACVGMSIPTFKQICQEHKIPLTPLGSNRWGIYESTLHEALKSAGIPYRGP